MKHSGTRGSVSVTSQTVHRGSVWQARTQCWGRGLTEGGGVWAAGCSLPGPACGSRGRLQIARQLKHSRTEEEGQAPHPAGGRRRAGALLWRRGLRLPLVPAPGVSLGPCRSPGGSAEADGSERRGRLWPAGRWSRLFPAEKSKLSPPRSPVPWRRACWRPGLFVSPGLPPAHTLATSAARPPGPRAITMPRHGLGQATGETARQAAPRPWLPGACRLEPRAPGGCTPPTV